jgi:hypothetical protein
MVFTFVCEEYAAKAIARTSTLLITAAEHHARGEYSQAREHADSAWETWRRFTAKKNLVLADLSLLPDVTVSLSRVLDSPDDRFIEECNATLFLLEHFLEDNRDFGDSHRMS